VTLRGTRRQALGAAFAGMVGLTLPAALRTAPAAADQPRDCFKGCAYTSGKRYQTALNACRTGTKVNTAIFFFISPFAGLAGEALNTVCFDVAALRTKADAFDCLQPNCPGFDPRAPGGPCDGCQDFCCTCHASDTGYICCVFSCDDKNHNCCPTG
jgi:hypothetical protein